MSSGGIYCLANDNSLDWTIALFESLRAHEPDLPLVIIPFDDRIEKLARLSDKYGFSIYDDPTLEVLDKIGASLSPGGHSRAHLYRKLAAFWGPLDHFLYLDSDIVVLDQLRPLLDSFTSSLYHFACLDNDIEQVYKPGPFRETMIQEYGSLGFNTGAFISSKGILTLAEVKDRASRASKVRENFVFTTGEQPFFNYCIDTLRVQAKSIGDIAPEWSSSAWAALRIGKHEIEGYRVMAPNSVLHNRKIAFVHWAGYKCNPYMPNRRLFTRHRVAACPGSLSRVRYLLIFYAVRLLNPKNLLRWVYRSITGR